MEMTRFRSDQNPDYQNVFSELRRLVESILHAVKEASGPASSKFSQTGEEKDHKQSAMHRECGWSQPATSVNNFSGTFNSGGGKMFQGNRFDSKGGPMNF